VTPGRISWWCWLQALAVLVHDATCCVTGQARASTAAAMGDDIAALQALLAGAFEQKSVVRLSERNVVELVRLRTRRRRRSVVNALSARGAR
jgi:hypothetical protein